MSSKVERWREKWTGIAIPWTLHADLAEIAKANNMSMVKVVTNLVNQAKSDTAIAKLEPEQVADRLGVSEILGLIADSLRRIEASVKWNMGATTAVNATIRGSLSTPWTMEEQQRMLQDLRNLKESLEGVTLPDKYFVRFENES